MNKDNFSISDVILFSASDYDEKHLFDFYEIMFPYRENFLKANWKWLYRNTFCNKKLPHILVFKNKIIAHSGMMPIDLSINGENYSAIWCIDLSVLTEFRRHGLFHILIKNRIEFSDFQMTFPNNNSYHIYKKIGWEESFNTYLHYNFISPLNHPKLVKKFHPFLNTIMNHLSYPFLYLLYKKY